jgi:ligand-binding sensor domain-containing protein
MKINEWVESLVKISCILMFFTSVQSSIKAQDYLYLKYSIRDGLPSNMVYGVTQDKYGQIWIGTDRGLSSFDGQRIRNYSRLDGLEDIDILDVFIDSKDRLWMSTFNGRLAFLKNGKFYHSRNAQMLHNWKNQASIFNITEGYGGRIYVKTSKALYRHNPDNTWMEIKGDSLLTRGLSRVISYNQKDIIFDPLGISEWDSKHQKVKEKFRFPYEGIVGINGIHGSYAINNHSFFGLNEKGVFKVDLRRDTMYQQLVNFDQLMLRQDEVKRIVAFEDCFWLLLYHGGALQVWENGTKRKVLPRVLINDIDKDRDGNYWVSSSDGLYLLPTYFFKGKMYTQKEGLPQDEILSLQTDTQRRLWIGTSKAKLAIMQKSNIQRINLFPQESVLQISRFLPYRDGMFISMYNRGLVLAQATQQPGKRIKLKEKFPIFTQSLKKKPSGEITYAHMNRVYVYDESRNKFKLTFFDSLERRIFLHHWDRKGQLWLSKPDGLTYINQKGLVRDLPSHKFPVLKEQMMDIQNLAEEEMIMAPLGFGIILLRNGQVVQHLTRKNGLPDDICTKILIFKKQIWVVCSNGIVELGYEKKKLFIKRYFDESNALMVNKINDIAVDDEHIFVATDQGMLILRQDINTGKMPPPKVVLTSMRTRLGEQIQLSNAPIYARHLPISIRFNALVYPANRMIEYQYRIGRERWITTEGGTLELPELLHGKYELQLRARIGGGQWGKITHYRFSVELPFYLQQWFSPAVVITLLSLGLLWLFYAIIEQENKKREALSNQMLLDRLESQALHSIMHPHFMFNALNSIQHFLNANDRLQANRYLSRFAKLMRINLNAGTKGYISIEDEVERLQHYLSLEALRLENVFTYDFEIDANLIPNGTFIPAMILQPYVENALWHGLAKVGTNGHLWIRFKWIDAQQIEVRIEDDGIGVKNSSAHKKNSHHRSQAIEIIRKRLEVFSRQFGVDFSATHSELKPENLDRPGHVVSIQLPFVDQHILEELL